MDIRPHERAAPLVKKRSKARSPAQQAISDRASARKAKFEALCHRYGMSPITVDKRLRGHAGNRRMSLREALRTPVKKRSDPNHHWNRCARREVELQQDRKKR